MAFAVKLHRHDWLVLAGGLVALVAAAGLLGKRAYDVRFVAGDKVDASKVHVFVDGREFLITTRDFYRSARLEDVKLDAVKEGPQPEGGEKFVPIVSVDKIGHDLNLIVAYGRLQKGREPEGSYVLKPALGEGKSELRLRNLSDNDIQTLGKPGDDSVYVLGRLQNGGKKNPTAVLCVYRPSAAPSLYLMPEKQPRPDPHRPAKFFGVEVRTDAVRSGVAQPLLAVFLIYWLLVSVVVVRRLRVQKGDAWPILRLPRISFWRRPGLRWIDGYRLLEELGDSSEKATMVFRARQEKDGRNYVLKILKPQYVKNAAIREGFLEEAKRLSSLSHPFIVRALDVGEGSLDDLGTVVPFFVMNVARGRSLRRLIKKGLSHKTALQIVMECCAALREPHAHQISHNDIKPENIFVELDSPRQSLRWLQLLDFGVSTNKEDETMGRVRGTPSYLSPEQARGEHFDARSDIFDLGLVLYEMISGKQVFPVTTSVADTIRTIASEDEVQIDDRFFGPELGQILRRMLRKNRDDRFQSVTELRAALENYYRSLYGVYTGLQAVR